MSASPAGAAGKQRRFIQLIVAAGLVGAVVMSLAMTNTLSAFVATIVNSNNTAATGAVVLQESGAGSAVCNSTDNNSINQNSFATCTAFNKYGGSTTLVPSNAAGTTNNSTTTVNFKNTGNSPASNFTMAFAACTQSNSPATTNNGSATDLCSKLHVKVTSGATVIQADALASSLANTTVTIPAALIPAANSGTTVPFTFTVYVDNSAGNTYQGLQAAQNITWTLAA